MPKKKKVQTQYRIEFDQFVDDRKIEYGMKQIECPMRLNRDLIGNCVIDCCGCNSTVTGTGYIRKVTGNGFSRSLGCHKLFVYFLGGELSRKDRGKTVRLNGGGTVRLVKYTQTIQK